MCEILVFARNNAHPDPEKDRRGCYKRGMIVAVKEDGHVWGRLESKQRWIADGNPAGSWPSQGVFVIVKIPGVAADRARALLDEQAEDDAGGVSVITNPEGQTLPSRYRRRSWRLLVDSIPPSIRNQLASNGEVTVTVAQIRNFLRRVRDNAQFLGLD